LVEKLRHFRNWSPQQREPGSNACRLSLRQRGIPGSISVEIDFFSV